MGEELADGDGGEFRGGVFEEGSEEFCDGVVPVEFAGLDPCGDERGGHGLGHGAEVPEVGEGGWGGVVAFADPGDACGGEAGGGDDAADECGDLVGRADGFEEGVDVGVGWVCAGDGGEAGSEEREQPTASHGRRKEGEGAGCNGAEDVNPGLGRGRGG